MVSLSAFHPSSVATYIKGYPRISENEGNRSIRESQLTSAHLFEETSSRFEHHHQQYQQHQLFFYSSYISNAASSLFTTDSFTNFLCIMVLIQQSTHNYQHGTPTLLSYDKLTACLKCVKLYLVTRLRCHYLFYQHTHASHQAHILLIRLKICFEDMHAYSNTHGESEKMDSSEERNVFASTIAPVFYMLVL